MAYSSAARFDRSGSDGDDRRDPFRAVTSGGERNVGDVERALSGAAGAALAVWGVRRGGVSGILATAAGGSLLHRALSGHCEAYAAADMNSARPRSQRLHEHGIHVRQSVTIGKPVGEVYAFWRKLENLPQFMDHLRKVEEIDEKRSHWTAKAPAGLSVSWEAEITEEEPDRLIAWRTLPGSTVPNAGRVEFRAAPGDRGTEIHVDLDYAPPGMQAGAVLARLFGENPKQQVAGDLRRLKQILEVGEIATIEGQPNGRSWLGNRIPHVL